MKKKILFINSEKAKCGVYEFGYRIGKVITNSKNFNITYLEISSQTELEKKYNKYKPHALIYNHTTETMPWLKTYKFLTPQIGIIHEITSSLSRNKYPDFFDYYIAPDPTLIINNNLVYKTGRLIFKTKKTYFKKKNKLIKIGSFGFGTENKDFLGVVKAISKEFPKSEINFNIPFATFGDADGMQAKNHIQKCTNFLKKFPNLRLKYSHEYLTNEELITFLKKNDINVFFYKDKRDRGISSVLDYALSACKPIAISECNMFRHVHDKLIIYNNKNSLKSILSRGDKIVKKYCKEWSPKNILWEYEMILNEIFEKHKNNLIFFYNFKYLKFKIEKLVRNFLKKNNPFISLWTHNHNYVKIIPQESKKYKITDLKKIIKYNRILSKKDLDTYKSSIKNLIKIAPDMMSEKDPQAINQQAFVFSAILNLIKNKKDKLLCIGNFQDPTYESLYKLGYNIAGVDPVLNYTLDNFIKKKSTIKRSYNLIFATSVLEHIKDDINFLNKCQILLDKGGILILTCDYKNDYKINDPLPGTNFRFYNRESINIILKKFPYLKPIDTLDLDTDNKNYYGDNIKYTFCCLVLKKVK